jgi:hypothetical protein
VTVPTISLEDENVIPAVDPPELVAFSEAIRSIPAPVVHVEVPAPVVHVNVPPPVRTRHAVTRDENGMISGVEEQVVPDS